MSFISCTGPLRPLLHGLPPRDLLQPRSRDTEAQLIGESFYFYKPTLARSSPGFALSLYRLLFIFPFSPSHCLSFCPPLPVPPYLPPLPPLATNPFFFLPPSFHSLRAGYRRFFQTAVPTINNIILIQTDIKRHRANRTVLCRLIISSYFCVPFRLCHSVPAISSWEGSCVLARLPNTGAFGRWPGKPGSVTKSFRNTILILKQVSTFLEKLGSVTTMCLELHFNLSLAGPRIKDVNMISQKHNFLQTIQEEMKK